MNRRTSSPGPAHLGRPPTLAVLRPFVERVWASCEEPRTHRRELVLPTGQAHLVVRVSEHPLTYAGFGAGGGRAFAHAVVGGPRWSPWVRDVSKPVRSLGAQLRPGAAELLFGIPAEALSGRHTPLEDLWPGARFRERLREVEGLPLQLDRFESLLAERVPDSGALHPVVAHALERFRVVRDVGPVVRETGYSHRQFVSLFRRAVGMPPKRWCRVRRFKAALDRLAATPGIAWADLALSSGFSDQAHLVREFRALSGLTPGGYRRLAPTWSRHVPLR